MSNDPIHDRLLEITLRLPGAYEDRPWGSVHCKVAGKIFIGWGRLDDGAMSMGFRTSKTLQAMLVASDPRFTIAKYVGQHGGTDMRIDAKPNWDEIEQFIVESYRLIAPKKLVKELDAREGKAPAAKTASAPKKPAAKKSPAKAVAKKPAAKKPAAKKAVAKQPVAKKAVAKPAKKSAAKKTK